MQSTYTTITINGNPVMDADSIREENPHLADTLNSLFVVTGRNPSRGWFAMLKVHFDALVLSANITIVWNWYVDGSPTTVTFAGFRVVDAFAATPNVIDGPMIIEVADVRIVNAETKRRYNDQTLALGGMDATSTWADALAGVSADFPVSTNFSLTSPPASPSPIIYECDGWTAICDLAARTGHIPFHDPIANQLKLAKFGTTQSGLAALLASATLYNSWTVPATTKRESINKVEVRFVWRAERVWIGDDPHVISKTNPSGGTGELCVWGLGFAEYNLVTGTSTPINAATLDIEAAAIANSIFAWSDQQNARTIKEFMGLFAFVPGSEVSHIRFQLREFETFTRVTIGDHPQPEFASTTRRHVESGFIVKSPGGGIPARSGATVTATTCDVHRIFAGSLALQLNSASATAQIVVHNLGTSAIAAADYALAVRQWDGTFAIGAEGMGGVNFTFVKTIGTLQPGGTTTGDVVIWDFATSAWIDDPSFASPVTINDSTISNFLSPNEIVRTSFNAVMDNYDIVGSRGLIQRGTVGADVEANATVVVTLVGPLTGTLSDCKNITGWGLKSGSFVLCIFEPPRGTSHANGYKLGQWHIVDTLTKIVKIQLTVTSPGEFAGDEDTACAFTYTVKNPETGLTIGTGVDPTVAPNKYKREEFGARKAATWGLAELNSAAGNWQITWINETLDVSACAAAGSTAPAFAADSYEIAAGLELEILANETMEIT